MAQDYLPILDKIIEYGMARIRAIGEQALRAATSPDQGITSANALIDEFDRVSGLVCRAMRFYAQLSDVASRDPR